MKVESKLLDCIRCRKKNHKHELVPSCYWSDQSSSQVCPTPEAGLLLQCESPGHIYHTISVEKLKSQCLSDPDIVFYLKGA